METNKLVLPTPWGSGLLSCHVTTKFCSSEEVTWSMKLRGWWMCQVDTLNQVYVQTYPPHTPRTQFNSHPNPLNPHT